MAVHGRPLSGQAMRYARSVEAYLQAGARPRWMERLLEIERLLARAERDLEHEWLALRAACAGEEFTRRWTERAHAWDFAALNELVRRHNEYYPVERDLPLDPRTGEFRTVMGRSHRREELGPEWVLARFPAV